MSLLITGGKMESLKGTKILIDYSIIKALGIPIPNDIGIIQDVNVYCSYGKPTQVLVRYIAKDTDIKPSVKTYRLLEVEE
jgi:hypothetical protein